MLSVTEALNTAIGRVHPMPPHHCSLSQALGQYLAEAVHSPVDMPPFAQSAMDGYALGNAADQGTTYRLTAHVRAGDEPQDHLTAGSAARIFTGAMLPHGTVCVAMQEHVVADGDIIRLMHPANTGDHMRPAGEQVKAHDAALPAGALLTPAALGYLAMLGISGVAITPRPRVGIITTGNETVPVGIPLPPAKVYECNSTALGAALREKGYLLSATAHVSDDPSETLSAISELLDESDALLITGGISAGDHDHVAHALAQAGVEKVFHGVNQKPGKPLWFGMRGHSPVFGLPGNPAAALTCLYAYVLPVLATMSGNMHASVTEDLICASGYQKTDGKTHLLKARTDGCSVQILAAQASSMLSSFALANALIMVYEDIGVVSPGDVVRVIRM